MQGCLCNLGSSMMVIQRLRLCRIKQGCLPTIEHRAQLAVSLTRTAALVSYKVWYTGNTALQRTYREHAPAAAVREVPVLCSRECWQDTASSSGLQALKLRRVHNIRRAPTARHLLSASTRTAAMLSESVLCSKQMTMLASMHGKPLQRTKKGA